MCRARGEDGSTVQLRAFLALQRCSMDATLLAQAMGTCRENARKPMTYLVRRGLVERHQLSPRVVIYAAVIGADPPTDQRGKPEACRNHRGEVARANIRPRVQAMRARHRELCQDEAFVRAVAEKRARRKAERAAKIAGWTSILFGAKPPPVDTSRARVHVLADD
jgi:predicted ArsR family transcriptional regulator